MVSLRRQADTYEYFDDQGPVMWGSFVGNWTHRTAGDPFYNHTITSTSKPGASFSFTFSGMKIDSPLTVFTVLNFWWKYLGSQAWLYGAPKPNGTSSYPTAEYLIDDSPGK